MIGKLVIVTKPIIVTALFWKVYIVRHSIWLLRRSPFMIHRNWNYIILCWNLLWSLRFCFMFNMGICTTFCLVNEGEAFHDIILWSYIKCRQCWHCITKALTLRYFIWFYSLPYLLRFVLMDIFEKRIQGVQYNEYTPSLRYGIPFLEGLQPFRCLPGSLDETFYTCITFLVALVQKCRGKVLRVKKKILLI